MLRKKWAEHGVNAELSWTSFLAVIGGGRGENDDQENVAF